MEEKCHKIIGYYVTEKKNAKMNWVEFGNVCRNHGFSLVKLNLQEDLEAQGPFFAIIHKMTEIILKASLGDTKAVAALENVESYINSHQEIIVFDPLDAVRSLLNRSRYYRILQNSDVVEDKVFTPTFVDLTSSNLDENLQRLKDAGVTYPFVCKPSVSHGSEAHQMAVVFNEKGVADCKPPCVAQSFINHNAVLYKIYIAGEEFKVSERPSLKNFSASDQKNIIFSTCDVSKPDSTSSLTVLDPEDAAAACIQNPDAARLQRIVSTLRRELGMMLLGVDVVIEHGSGRYGIIDINIFPSYDGFPNFFQCLMDNILKEAAAKTHCSLDKRRKSTDDTTAFASERKYENTRHFEEHSTRNTDSFPEKCLPTTSAPSEKTTTSEYDQDDSGFDTGDSSDERKKKWCLSRGRGGHGKKVSQHIKSFSHPMQIFCANLSENCVGAGLSGV